MRPNFGRIYCMNKQNSDQLFDQHFEWRAANVEIRKSANLCISKYWAEWETDRQKHTGSKGDGERERKTSFRIHALEIRLKYLHHIMFCCWLEWRQCFLFVGCVFSVSIWHFRFRKSSIPFQSLVQTICIFVSFLLTQHILIQCSHSLDVVHAKVCISRSLSFLFLRFIHGKFARIICTDIFLVSYPSPKFIYRLRRTLFVQWLGWQLIFDFKMVSYRKLLLQSIIQCEMQKWKKKP